jgi:hypothetical protein
VSFLNQLKTQAKALQAQQGQVQLSLAENTAQAEKACRHILPYLHDLANQLNVSGFAVFDTTLPAAQIRTDVLDELAKLIVSEPSRFA